MGALFRRRGWLKTHRTIQTETIHLISAEEVLMQIQGSQMTDQPQGKGKGQLFWRLERMARPPMYFLGALHFGSAEMYPLSESVLAAYRNCDTLVFETDLAKVASAEFHNRMDKDGHLEENDHLRNHVKAETWQALVSHAVRLGYTAEYIDRLRSWYCGTLLTSAALRETGLSSHLGVDGFIFQQAYYSGRRLFFLETPEHQLELLETINANEDESFIQNIIAELDNMPVFTRQMLELWLSGDAEALGELISKGFSECQPLQERILRERNRLWLEKFKQLNEAGNSIFISIMLLQ